MWKDIFANPKTDEEDQSMLEDFKRSRPVHAPEDAEGPAARGPDKVNSFLDQGTEFEGKLAFEGVVRVNGKFSGEIFSEGTLYVGESGKVNAEIQVDTVVINGDVTGDVTASTKVELQKTGRLHGNIRTQVLKIDEGALFEGSCQMRVEGAPKRQTSAPRATGEPPASEQKGLAL
jgi:cytoskeletal protein CcmA (bactofilin family)